MHDAKADVGSESNDDSEYESYNYESEMHVGFEDSSECNNEVLEDEIVPKIWRIHMYLLSYFSSNQWKNLQFLWKIW